MLTNLGSFCKRARSGFPKEEVFRKSQAIGKSQPPSLKEHKLERVGKDAPQAIRKAQIEDSCRKQDGQQQSKKKGNQEALRKPSPNQRTTTPNDIEVLEKGLRGKVKFFHRKRKVGFIVRNDNGKEVFVHVSGITNGSRKRLGILRENEEVEFDLVKTDKTPKAINVASPAPRTASSPVLKSNADSLATSTSPVSEKVL